MNWLKSWLSSNLHNLVGSSSIVSVVQFLYQIWLAAQDGVIDNNEMHNLITSASGVQWIMLLVAYGFLRPKQK